MEIREIVCWTHFVDPRVSCQEPCGIRLQADMEINVKPIICEIKGQCPFKKIINPKFIIKEVSNG